MEELKDKLLSIQIENFESRWYIPGKELERLINPQIVEKAILECGIEPYKRAEAIRVILEGAKKVFATLVLMGKASSILNFIEHDHLQGQPLDAKLPFHRGELAKILSGNQVEMFHRTQWTVAVPLFRNDLSHRILEDSTILPLAKNSRIGSGAFGTVFEATFDGRHQWIEGDGQASTIIRAVRKEVMILSPDEDHPNEINSHEAPGREGHVLSLLRLIKHPSIARLMASYSYRGTYNLLFPRAENDLETFLQKTERSSGFQSDDTFFLAMQGLCEAVAVLHRFIAPELGLWLKGYHHDLKPDNVLVDGAKFIITDFGLSTLKEMSAKSKTISKTVNGYYLAPECESFEDGFQKNLIGQPSDIWALGCILSVVLTYMRKGVAGVEDFERRRKFRVMNWTTYQFHNAGAFSSAVDAWLTKLGNDSSPEVTGLLKLIREMLSTDPSDRPDAQEVSARMNFLAAKSLYHSVERAFKTFAQDMNDLVVSIERDRLTLFGQAAGFGGIDQDCGDISSLLFSMRGFGYLQTHLSELRDMLDTAVCAPRLANPSPLIHGQLRRLVDRLWNLLSAEVRLRLGNAMDRKLLDTENLSLLSEIQSRFREDSNYRNLGLLAAIKYMTLLADHDQLSGPSLRHSPDRISQIETDISPQVSLAKLRPGTGVEEKRVLVEWLQYDTRWQEEVGQELFIRMEAVAELLRTPEKPSGFRGLRCVGYYHNRSRHSFGLIFDLPSLRNVAVVPQESFTLSTLESLIRRTRMRKERPSLGDVFQLARTLATSVLEWHKVGWLHKSISAFNVVCFDEAFDTPLASIVDPYIIGFNHSRPNEPNAVTLGPPDTPDQMDYCHPEYLKGLSRYRPEYDYYSLGLVLLEIGLWRTIKSLTSGFTDSDQSPEKLRDWLLEKHVSRLHITMGRVYQEAVRTCLTMQSGSDSGEHSHSLSIDALEAFEHQVVTQIGRCFA